MSEVLARIRVKEEHGIRRFLYPLSTLVNLPAWTDLDSLCLMTEKGDAVPLQVTLHKEAEHRLDFAVSLHPKEEAFFELVKGEEPALIPDPLQVTQADEISLRSRQERFEIALGEHSQITNVIYDGVAHLTDSTAIIRVDRQSQDPRYLKGIMVAPDVEIKSAITHIGGGPLTSWSETQGTYTDGSVFTTRTEITACKSWAAMTHRLENPRSEEDITFGIPLTVTTPIMTYDTGVGNGIYGKVQAEYVLIFWHKNGHQIEWESGIIQGRDTSRHKDYIGVTERQEDFDAQRWFHIIDGHKALAVAITHLPSEWNSLIVWLTPTGIVNIGFRTKNLSGPAEFGVCYHFLNDIPAIAAATNPQSILLPPTVEVLPV